MRSAYSPERLEVELQSLLGPSLSNRGYRVVGHGVSGVTWRRNATGKLIGGLVVLGFIALGGLTSGSIGAMVLGVASAAAGVALFCLRRPATLTVSLVRVAGGTEIGVSSGPDAAKTEQIVRTVAGPEPSPPHAPEVPASR